uniref:Probable queuosine precursor transporter n=1 Tax=Geoglobus ahangari TaxID=113653 RepID=A0A7C3YMR3_9EURY
MLFEEFILWAGITLASVCLVLTFARIYGKEIAIGIYAVLTVVANIIAVKLISVGGITAPAGVIVYSVTFLVTDFISEIYGKEAAKKAIITGLVANIIAVLSIIIAVKMTPAPFLSKEVVESFNTVFTFTPRIVAASLIAFIISQTHDIYAYHFLRMLSKGKHMWLRNNVSTSISQLIDTTVFITVAFYGVAPLLPLIAGQYVLKLIIALFDTPFLYISVETFKKLESDVNIVQG